MHCYWLITWRTYGTWLAGSERGFVSNVYAPDGGPEIRHNTPGTEYDRDMPGLERHVQQRMRDAPYHLQIEQAAALQEQFLKTSQIREYELGAASIMHNHVHLLVGVTTDPDPHRLQELYKSWATRALKARWPLPKSGHFFAANGSVRKKTTEEEIETSVIYVACKQPNALAVHVHERWQPMVAAWHAEQSQG
jgi:REP element-mobilizing transposase RayT